MWFFWSIFVAIFITAWRLALLWRATRPNTITDSLDNWTHGTGEMIEAEDPPSSIASAGSPSSVASAGEPCSVASPRLNGRRRHTWNERNCTIVAGLGGLIVGYLTSVTGGLIALPNYLILISRVIFKNEAKSYQDDFCYYRNQWLFLYSSAIHFMAIIGIVLALFLIHWGRGRVLRSGVVVLLLGISSMEWFPNIYAQGFGLLITGFGVGLIHQVTRTIYTEAIPRDATWKVFEWGSILGSLGALVANYIASHYHVWGWRMSTGMAGIPSLLLLIQSYFIIESPQYLIEQNCLEKAKTNLTAIRGSNIEVEFSELVASIEKKQSTNAFREILAPPNRPALIITTVEMIFGNFSGVELLIYYGPFLLESIQPVQQLAFLAPVILAIAQTTAKGVVALSIRQTGRRMIFLAAYLAAIITLVSLGVIFHLNPNQKHHLKSHPATISAVLVGLHAFSNGILSGPYGWIDSRFPEECHDLGSAYEFCLGLSTTFVANQISLHLLCALREWIFFFYAIWSFLLMCFTLGFIPETTGIRQHKVVRRVWHRHWFWLRYMLDSGNLR